MFCSELTGKSCMLRAPTVNTVICRMERTVTPDLEADITIITRTYIFLDHTTILSTTFWIWHQQHFTEPRVFANSKQWRSTVWTSLRNQFHSLRHLFHTLTKTKFSQCAIIVSIDGPQFNSPPRGMPCSAAHMLQ